MTTTYAEDLKDIEYGRAGKVSLRFDAHIPNGPGPFAAVIMVHGGAWVTGDRTNNVQPLFQPLSDAGLAWFSISYRLAADVARNPIGAAMQMGTAESDVRKAVAFVKRPRIRVSRESQQKSHCLANPRVDNWRPWQRSGRARMRRYKAWSPFTRLAIWLPSNSAHLGHDSRWRSRRREGNSI